MHIIIIANNIIIVVVIIIIIIIIIMIIIILCHIFHDKHLFLLVNQKFIKHANVKYQRNKL